MFLAENVEFLLELGDKFEIQFVIDQCEQFLMRSEDIPIVTKLVWADQYCLAKLQVETFVLVNLKNAGLVLGCLHSHLQADGRYQIVETNRRIQKPQ